MSSEHGDGPFVQKYVKDSTYRKISPFAGLSIGLIFSLSDKLAFTMNKRTVPVFIVPLDDSYSFDAKIGNPQTAEPNQYYNSNGGTNGSDGGISGGINGGINENRINMIIQTIKSDNTITVAAIADKLKIPKRTVEREIAALKKLNRIRHVGSTKAGHWELL